MIRTEEERSFAHYGTPRHSGRYPWGSGDPESTRNRDFLHTVKKLRSEGMTDAEIARGMGISRNELTARRSIYLAQEKQAKISMATRLREKGWSHQKIGERMGGIPESSVRALLRDGEKDKADVIQKTANVLRDQVKEKQMVDVGRFVEKQMGITRNRLDTAVAVLKEEGHNVYNIQIQQIHTGKYTTMKVLAAPGLSKSYVQQNRKDIRQIVENYSPDHGRTYFHTQPPLSISSKRLAINYAESGGGKLDGVIHIRPGVKDLSIGSKRYGQVRIMIDGTHYIKGMALYKEDLPTGKDLVFHTKLHNTGRKKDAMKPLEGDPNDPEGLPFGSIIRQVHDHNGKVISAVNLVGSPTKEGSGEEGHWDTWRREISSQMLSKQRPVLAKQQLDLTFDRRKRELDEIMALTNPTVRQELLTRFADATDAAAVHLSAANMRRQANKVLLPVPSMKADEIYAPTFRDGERVVLIRHPHGGTFEIPELTVNNRNREARKLLGSNAADAVGIHHKVAERLSGADFDGDTVLVIPNKGGAVKHTPALEGLKGFDPIRYKLPADSPIPKITSARKQTEMGKISNLITDMTLKGANTEQLARAIRHSMVVIDSEKHNLNWKQSEHDNGILALKEEYQGKKSGGASTLISRAGSPKWIEQRQPRPMRRGGPIDPRTGQKVFEPTGRMVPDFRTRTVIDPATGQKVRQKVQVGMKPKKQKVKKLEVTDNAFGLVADNDNRMEVLYANHSNRLKAMANAARKEAVNTTTSYKTSPSAKKAYAKEVESINSKLDLAERNAPYERQAQLLANSEVSQKRQANPHIEEEEVKKIKTQALNTARNRTGASKTKIRLTQSEWDAIQAHAISKDKLERILNNSDMDTVKALAMPKHVPKLTSAKKLRAQTMLNSGYTQAEVADALGIGLTTLKVSLSE